jgi:hypothetical protein
MSEGSDMTVSVVEKLNLRTIAVVLDVAMKDDVKVVKKSGQTYLKFGDNDTLFTYDTIVARLRDTLVDVTKSDETTGWYITDVR